MDNQHKKITGYRDLSQAEIDLMNEIKAEGERLRELTDKVGEHLKAQWSTTMTELATPEEKAMIDRLPDADRMLEASILQFKLGLMTLTRCIAQPTSF